MSVARNLYLGTEPRTRWGLLAVDEMNRNATALLRRYGIDIDVRRPVRSFGAGVQQMIAIVRAVSTDARVVILDEPTSSLEPREVAQVFEMIRRLRAAGVALLFVSHNLDEVFPISDRITILRDGRRAPTSSSQGHDQARGDRHDARSRRRRGSLRRAGRASTAGQQVGDEVVLEAGRASRRHQLHDVSLSVRAGEVLGLAGLLGSGRSETVRAIFGTQRLDGGRRARRRASASERAHRVRRWRRGPSLLPEDRKSEGIVPTMSVRDNIVLMALPKVSRWGFVSPGASTGWCRLHRSARDQDVGSGQNIGQLSGGNQQKALLARLLCTEPKVLLLDEPTRGIDIGAKAEVQSLVQQLADQGRGIVLISSELEDVVEGSTRVVVLNNGTVVGELGRDEVDEHRIMELMAAPCRSTEDAGGA